MKLCLKLGIAGACLLAIGAIFGYAIFPPFMDSQLKEQVTLKPGSEIRRMWEVTPFPLDFRIFLFNITNPAEIEKGAKPVVNEVGPFFYHEYKEKVNLVDNDEEDTCEYNNKATWRYDPDKSGMGLSEETVLTFPHAMILTLIMTVMRSQPGTISIATKAVDSIFHQPDSVFIQATVKEILWTGVPIDCTVEDFQGKTICAVLAENDGVLLKDGPGKYRFALLGAKNGTVLPDRLKVKRGVKNYLEVGEMVGFKGQPSLDIWGEEGSCNNLTGTDSTAFHPLLYKDEDIVTFTQDICLSIVAYYVKPSEVKGVPTNFYNADYGDMSTDENLKCLCEEDKCLKKGLVDLFPCLSAPMVASLPHFYLVDEFYLTQVDGLHPDKEEHQIFLNFEPMTATPMEARKRLQFNMFIYPIKKFRLMTTFPEALLPLFWIEEGLLLEDKYVDQVKMVYTVMSVVGIVKWLMIIGGIALLAAAWYLRRRGAEKSTMAITEVTPKTTANAPAHRGGEKKSPLNVTIVEAQASPTAES